MSERLIKSNLDLVKASPIRALLGFAALIPALSFTAAILAILAVMGVESCSTLLMYGLSGLDRPFEMERYKKLSDFFMSILSFFAPVSSLPLKIAIIIPYSIASCFLLASAQKQLDRRKDGHT